ncbi:MAG: ABC transporter permease subunit [Bacteroidetes bacterium]|nr:ABC transporter permease subunit [Bacteroidota bacterium]
MLQLVYVELIKIFTKPRSYIGFLAVTAVILLIQFAMYIDGRNYLDFMLQTMRQSFDIGGNILNGHLVCFIILQTLIMQMPLMVALVTGDLISGEAASGTIRLLATRPYSRGQILLAKYLAGTIYTVALVLWLGILALGLSRLLFGHGDIIVLKTDSLTIVRDADLLWRFFSAFFIAILSLMVVATFSLMLSCFTDNSIGPIIVSMSVIIVFTIIGTLEVPFFDHIKPLLFTTHMVIWRNMFDDPLPLSQITTSVSVLVAHIVVFLAVSFYYFTRKDIQS